MSDTAYYLTHTFTELLPKIAVSILMTSLLLGLGFGWLRRMTK